MEAAIKFSRVSTGRTGIIAAMRGFHGRTMGALSATWNKKYREAFEPLVPDYSHVPYNNIGALEKAVTDKTAAVTARSLSRARVASIRLTRPTWKRCANFATNAARYW